MSRVPCLAPQQSGALDSSIIFLNRSRQTSTCWNWKRYTQPPGCWWLSGPKKLKTKVTGGQKRNFTVQAWVGSDAGEPTGEIEMSSALLRLKRQTSNGKSNRSVESGGIIRMRFGGSVVVQRHPSTERRKPQPAPNTSGVKFVTISKSLWTKAAGATTRPSRKHCASTSSGRTVNGSGIPPKMIAHFSVGLSFFRIN